MTALDGLPSVAFAPRSRAKTDAAGLPGDGVVTWPARPAQARCLGGPPRYQSRHGRPGGTRRCAPPRPARIGGRAARRGALAVRDRRTGGASVPPGPGTESPHAEPGIMPPSIRHSVVLSWKEVRKPMASQPVESPRQARNPTGQLLGLAWLMIIWTICTVSAAQDLPHWWWPHATATVAECEPGIGKSSGSVFCTLNWFENGAQHTTVMAFTKRHQPLPGSTLTLAVNGNAAQEPRLLLKSTLFAVVMFTGQAATFVGLVLWYRRARPRWRSRWTSVIDLPLPATIWPGAPDRQ